VTAVDDPVDGPVVGTGGVTGPGGGAGVRLAAVNGMRWSLLNTVVTRSASVASGVVVARVLAPADFGVFAVGFVVVTVLLSVNDLGVTPAVVREGADVARIAPTVTTLAWSASALVFGVCWFAAPALADVLGAPGATGVVRLLAVGVLVDAVGAVPAAVLTREFRQRRRMAVDAVASATTVGLTVGLAFGGAGAWSLAIGATSGTALGAVLTLASVDTRYRPGFDRAVARELLAQGAPLAGSSLLLLALLNVDYVVVGHQLGPSALGTYLVAFNLCTWPVTVVVVTVRRVALAAFARWHHTPVGAAPAFTASFASLVTCCLPLCLLLALFGPALVAVLYGPTWSGAGPVVAVLAVLTLGRVAGEISYDYLVAVGAGPASAMLYGVWLVALVPAMVVGVRVGGVLGAGVAHAVVVVVVLVPTLAVVLRRHGVRWRSALAAFRVPVTAAAAAAMVGVGVLVATTDPWWRVVGGGVAVAAVYAACARRPLLGILRAGPA
jgi:O-antigen/teichoic acid export membrane protein